MPRLSDPGLFRTLAYVNGQWAPAGDGRTAPVTNPATGDELGTVPLGGAAETRAAIEAAATAWPAWRERTASDRALILRRFRDLMMEHQEDLAILMTAEQGKPLTESRGEIAYAAGFIEWFAVGSPGTELEFAL